MTIGKLLIVSIISGLVGVAALLLSAPRWALILCMLPVLICLVLTLFQIFSELKTHRK